MSLKEKTINGFFWSFIDTSAIVGSQFVIGIILARLLSPAEFGLIGMLTVFIAIAQSFVDSGFGNALIRKNKCTKTDYSTVFIFNFFTSIFFYLILYFFAPYISDFYSEPKLIILLRVLGLSVIINALNLVNRVILTKEINFKLQTKISIYSSFLSGIIGISMAYQGFGVWSLVAMTLTKFSFETSFFFFFTKQQISGQFSWVSFRELFSYGSKLLLSGLIDTLYKNIYVLIIGKYFTASDLGYFTRAEQLKNIPIQQLSTIVSRVSFPVLSSLQEDKLQLRIVYRKLIRLTMWLTFIIMFGIAAMSESLVVVLLGIKWYQSAIYLQLLAIAGVLYPLHALNLNMLQLSGRSDLFLYLEILKKILAIPIIILGIFLGIKMMIIGMIFISFIAFFLNSLYAGKFISYSSWSQIKDIFLSFLLSISIGFIVYLINFLPISIYFIFLLQIILLLILPIILGETFRINEYIELKQIFESKIKEIYTKK